MSLIKKTLKKLNIKTKVEKEKDYESHRAAMTGFYIESAPKLRDCSKLLFVLTNAVINFLIISGTFGNFLDNFEIKYNVFMVMTCTAVFSLFTAFLYFNRWSNTIGYILALSGFIYGVINYAWIINSGFGTIANTIMEYLEKDMDLPIERRYNTYEKNPEFAVTICMIFVVFAFILVFNMAITESKGVALVFLFTFPILQMGMYFDIPGNRLYVLSYFAGIVALHFLRNTRHYKMEYKKRKGYQKRTKKIRVKKEKSHSETKIIYDYVNDGKISFYITIFIILIAMLPVLLFTSFDREEYVLPESYSELKNSTRDYVKRFALVGFQGMLKGDGKSAGGVGRNRMGETSKVSLDFQNDLIVKTPRVDKETSIYLKCFNGTYYTDAYWETISEHKKNQNYLLEYAKENNLDSINESNIYTMNSKLETLYFDNTNYKKIQVINVGANSSYYYVPYLSNMIMGGNQELNDKFQSYLSNTATEKRELINDDEYNGRFKNGWFMDLWYWPFYNMGENVYEVSETVKNKVVDTEGMGVTEVLETEKQYRKYVYDTYLEVPEKNVEAIDDFLRENDIEIGDSETGSENINVSSNEVVDGNMLENNEEKEKDESNPLKNVEKVIMSFYNNYEYTLMPGKTPKDEEFVNYFLSRQKKGYCVYFASAATLIFRRMGIPARYTTGYKLNNDVITDGEECKNEDIYEWTGLYSDMKVYEIGVTDTCAHAWVEVYVDGLGWYPVEVTPMSILDEEEEDSEKKTGGIAEFFGNNVFTAQTANAIKNTGFGIITIAGILAVLSMVIFQIYGIITRKKRHTECIPENNYLYLMKCMSFVGINKTEFENYESFESKMMGTEYVSDEEARLLTAFIEKEKFSLNGLSDNDKKKMSVAVNEISGRIYNSLNWYNKIKYRYIKML